MSQILTRFALVFSLILSGSASAQEDLQPFKITADTPIISSPAQSTMVLKDPAGDITVQQALNRVNEFVLADKMEPLDAHSQYWIMQRISSDLTDDREYHLQGPWLSIYTYVIRSDGSVTVLRPAGYGYGYSPLSDIDPAKAGSSKISSASALFTLHAGDTLTLLSHSKALPTFTRNYILRVVDHAKFLETRRFGLYVEGALLGILFALGVFGWYSYLLNKDRTSLLYGI